MKASLDSKPSKCKMQERVVNVVRVNVEWTSDGLSCPRVSELKVVRVVGFIHRVTRRQGRLPPAPRVNVLSRECLIIEYPEYPVRNRARSAHFLFSSRVIARRKGGFGEVS